MAPKHSVTPSVVLPLRVSSPSISKSTVRSSDSSSHSGPQRPARRITPVVRVIQIFSPTKINTDVANFRALVQEMTGNSSPNSDRSQTCSSEKTTKGNGHKKRKKRIIGDTYSERRQDAVAPLATKLPDLVSQSQPFEQLRDNAVSGAIQNNLSPILASSLYQCGGYAQLTAHQENAYADVRPILHSGPPLDEGFSISRSSPHGNSAVYVDQCSLFNTDLDVLGTLNIVSSSNSPEMNQLTGLPESSQYAPISNTCLDYNNVLQQQCSWRFPVPPVFQSAYDQF